MNKNNRNLRAANRLKRQLARGVEPQEIPNGDHPAATDQEPESDDEVELSFKVDPVTMLRIEE